MLKKKKDTKQQQLCEKQKNRSAGLEHKVPVRRRIRNKTVQRGSELVGNF